MAPPHVRKPNEASFAHELHEFTVGDDAHSGSKTSLETAPKVRREIRVRVHIRRVISIDIVSREFTCEYLVEASWIDKSLKGRRSSDVDEAASDQKTGRLFLLNDPDTYYYSPRLQLANLVRSETLEQWFGIYDDTPKGGGVVVCFNMAGIGCFQQETNLRSFPLDSQDFNIIVKAYFPADEIKLTVNRNPRYRSLVSTIGFMQRNEYKLSGKVQMTPGQSDALQSASGTQYPTMTISIHAQRLLGYWVWNVIVPMFCFVLVSFASFALPTSNLDGRLSVSLSALLTMVAHKIFLAEKLPQVNYSTVLDKYAHFCLFMAIAIIIQNVFYSLLEDLDATSEHRQQLWLYIATGVWIVLHVAVIPFAIYCVNYEKSKREHERWWHAEDALWIGPLKNQETTAEIRDLVKKTARKALVRLSGNPVVRVFDPSEERFKDTLESGDMMSTNRFAIARLASAESAIKIAKYCFDEAQKSKDRGNLVSMEILMTRYRYLFNVDRSRSEK